ncbi:DNA methyltransferase [Thermodesulfovibrio hydrogeniphilus]
MFTYVNSNIAFRIRRSDLDFPTVRAKEGRHKIHDYPAMLHYKVVEYLIKEFGEKAKILYDPFCGSGVCLVEGLKQGKNVIGTDINPLALLISDVRTQNIANQNLDDILHKIKQIFNKVEPDIPQVKNIEYWFKENVITALGKLKNAIKHFTNSDIYKFLLVVFSQTVRKVSNNRKGEFKRYRINSSKLITYNPNVWEEFEKLFYEYGKALTDEYLPLLDKKLLLIDVRTPLDFFADLVITSPPYGDSRTTVAYGEFSSFSLEWLQGLNPYGDIGKINIDRLSLGGNNLKTNIAQKVSDYVYELAKTLCHIDEKRASDVFSYFDDLFLACKNIVEVVRENGTIIFIVGNRTIKGIQIQTDIAIKEFFESLNCKHLFTFVRKISNKRMPIFNSPSNKPGQTQETMNEEFIVVMKKGGYI